MAGFTPQLVQKFEFCVLAYDPIQGAGQAVVRRSGSSMASGEHGQFSKLLELLGQSGWQAVGPYLDERGNQTGLLFQRAIR